MSAQGPTVERVIAEAYCKAAEVILEGRIASTVPTKPNADAQRGRAWFNLEVAEVEGAAKALERWRRESGLPLVLEVFLRPWGAQAAGAAGGQQDKTETLLERWVVHYYPQLPETPSHLSRSQLSRLNPSSVYKRLVITLRSLCTFVRVLPAYRMYRACKRQRGANFTLGYRLHSTLPGKSAASAPGSRRMQSFRFGPVDTPYGQFRIGVDYQPASTVTILEQTTSPPPLPQIIADYVGSPRRQGSSGAQPPLRHAMSVSAIGQGSAARGTDSAAATAASPLSAQARNNPLLSASPPAQPGASPRAGGFIRRSWSSSLRGASPHRALLQPAAELPSPQSARETPYGSAPQAVSLPAMLRALSTPAGRYPVGSPAGGKPPLAKPPRPAMASHSGGPASQPQAIPSCSSSPIGSGALAAAVAAEEAGEEHGDGSLPRGGSAGSMGSAGARQSSAPMSIPGRGAFGAGQGGTAGRRLRSSGDLWALQQAANMRKPLSAPAVSHMQQAAASAGATGSSGLAEDAGPEGAAGSARTGGGRDVQPPSPSPPAARLPLLPGTGDSESGGSAASSLYPTSCSPQLPFAFTPSAQSLASFGARGALQESARLDRISPRLARTQSVASPGTSLPHQAAALALAAQQQQQQRAAAPAAAAGGHSAAPAGCSGGGFSPSSGSSGGSGVAGREVPSSTALMRRPSWSSRSSSAYNQLSGEASQAGGVGYSVSPMQDPSLESMLAGSTPRQFSLASGGLPSPLAPSGSLPPPGSAPAGAPISRISSTASTFSSAAPPLLTYPSVSGEIGGGADEADEMPFALDDGSTSPFKSRSPALPQRSLGPAGEQLPVCTAAVRSANDAHPLAAPARSAGPASSNPAGGPAQAAAPAVAASAPAVDTDAAVGAFVRLIQEAPPLRMHTGRVALGRTASADLAAVRLQAATPGTSTGSDSSRATCLSDGRGLTLQAGLLQFSRIKERLQQRGVMVGP